MIFMLVIAVYDVLAVRFGLMVWMADKLSGTTSLPAFIFPKKTSDLKLGLQAVQVGELKKEAADKREHTILGGGDIGFPLMLSNSVYFAYNMNAAILTGAFGIVGLIGAFVIQKVWLKGKPMPALPPIAIVCLIGFLIASNFPQIALVKYHANKHRCLLSIKQLPSASGNKASSSGPPSSFSAATISTPAPNSSCALSLKLIILHFSVFWTSAAATGRSA